MEVTKGTKRRQRIVRAVIRKGERIEPRKLLFEWVDAFILAVNNKYALVKLTNPKAYSIPGSKATASSKGIVMELGKSMLFLEVPDKAISR